MNDSWYSPYIPNSLAFVVENVLPSSFNWSTPISEMSPFLVCEN